MFSRLVTSLSCEQVSKILTFKDFGSCVSAIRIEEVSINFIQEASDFQAPGKLVLQLVPLVPVADVLHSHVVDLLAEVDLLNFALLETSHGVYDGFFEQSELTVRQTVDEGCPVGTLPELSLVLQFIVVVLSLTQYHQRCSVVLQALGHVTFAFRLLHYPEVNFPSKP